MQYVASKSALAFRDSHLLRTKPSAALVFQSDQCPNTRQLKSNMEELKSLCFFHALRHWEREMVLYL